jgi:hypothetical protein
MRTYVDNGRTLSWNGLSIPKASGNSDYAEALRMVDLGEAEIVAYVRPLPTVEDREAVKAAIDTAAEAARCRFITPGAGQSMVYLEKRAEAERYVASGGTGDYPILSASVGIEAENLAGVVALVRATAAGWTALAATIETRRLGAKKAVDQAEAWEAIEAAAAIGWPAP